MADRVTSLGDGVYQVDVDGRRETVYVAGPLDDRWIFWNGQVFRADVSPRATSPRRGDRPSTSQALAAPMPAKVIAVNVRAGDSVKKGDTVVLLEAMKMELPVRAPSDAVVAAVRCRAGELVDADATLVELK